MNSKIADTLNLPKISDMFNVDVNLDENSEVTTIEEPTIEEPSGYVVNTNEYDRELEKQVADQSQLYVHEKEMDEIHKLAMKAHKDTLDLGFNVEHRNAGTIFESSTNYLKLALEASRSKSDQRLKVMKLRLEKERLANSTQNKSKDEYVVGEDGILANRNDIIKYLKERNKEQNK